MDISRKVIPSEPLIILLMNRDKSLSVNWAGEQDQRKNMGVVMCLWMEELQELWELGEVLLSNIWPLGNVCPPQHRCVEVNSAQCHIRLTFMA